MVTFKDLGSFGRLGNQLFQVASTIGISKNNNHKYIFPHWKYSCYFQNILVQDSIFEINKESWTVLNYESSPIFNQIKLENTGNFNLRGYFQSEKYFIDHKDLITEVLTPKEKILNTLKEKYIEITNGKKTCSLHVRRGDYLKFSDYYNLLTPDNYYNQSIDQFDNETLFLIFSDDLEWCKNTFKGDRFVFVENDKDIKDLFFMSLCDNNIIANSSFSWWAAWLNNNKDKKVIAPEKWFGEKYNHLSVEDLIPSTWIKI